MKATSYVGDAFARNDILITGAPVAHHGQYLLLSSTPKSVQVVAFRVSFQNVPFDNVVIWSFCATVDERLLS